MANQYTLHQGTANKSNLPLAQASEKGIELIKITENDGKQAVSARELHEFLESKQQFSDWIKNRVDKYGFVEGQDFEVFHNFMENPQGGRPLTEYALTLDAAKELAMVEGNDKGKQARRYFIECEKRLREASPKVPTTFREALLLAAEQQAKIEEQQKQLEIQAPKAEFFDAVADSKTAISLGEAAKVLAIPGIGRNKLFEILREKNVLMKDNVPYQCFVDRGYFRVLEQHYTKNGEPCINVKTLVYQRGLDYIRKVVA